MANLGELGNVVKVTASQYEDLLAGETVAGQTYNANNIYLVGAGEEPIMSSNDFSTTLGVTTLKNHIYHNWIQFKNASDAQFYNIYFLDSSDWTGHSAEYITQHLDVLLTEEPDYILTKLYKFCYGTYSVSATVSLTPDGVFFPKNLTVSNHTFYLHGSIISGSTVTAVTSMPVVIYNCSSTKLI